VRKAGTEPFALCGFSFNVIVPSKCRQILLFNYSFSNKKEKHQNKYDISLLFKYFLYFCIVALVPLLPVFLLQ